MDTKLMTETARAMVAPGKGLLAADESAGTCKKRFDSVNVESTEENRRAYREMLFTTPGLADFVSGVILFDETLRQKTKDGVNFADHLKKNGILPGIKVDAGVQDMALHPGEKVSEATLEALFHEIERHGVSLEHVILKASMVVSGKDNARQAGVQEVAERTLRVLKRTVPAALPGVVFLSGGQTDENATAHLDAMNRIGAAPWPLTFSYSRALQAVALKAWRGAPGNVAAAQKAFQHRARMNSLAAKGQWKAETERQAA